MGRYEQFINKIMQHTSGRPFEGYHELYLKLGAKAANFPSVHIAGTNGKGSVAFKIAKSLQANGFKVGLVTSPHIESFLERIQINDQWIPEETLLEIGENILKAREEGDFDVTFFDIACLISFEYFTREKIDIAVFEVGVGGGSDPTIEVDTILSVITSIDFDHQEYLGDTLDAIARHKAGIIKPHVPVVIGKKANLPTVTDKAEELSAPFHVVSQSSKHYGEENTHIASLALDHLPKRFYCKERRLDAVPPCRFEWAVPGKVVLDVAHNPDGIRSLISRLDLELNKETPLHFFVAFKQDKEIDEMLSVLRERGNQIYLPDVDHLYVACGSKHALAKEHTGELTSLLKRALDHLQDGVLVVCGTFFMMDEVKRYLKSVNLLSRP